MAEEGNFSLTPRLWYSFVLDAEMADDGDNITVTMPLYGATLSYRTDEGVLSITGLHGSGEDSRNDSDLFAGVNVTGSFNADVTRTDVEAIYQQPLGKNGANWFYGGRYIYANSLTDLSGSGTIHDGKRVYDTTLNYYFAEIGAGSSNALDEAGRDHFFGNVTFMLGHSRQEGKRPVDGTTNVDSGLTAGVDTNFGYAHTTANSGTVSARYRILAVSDPDMDNKGGGFSNVVHGPEINWTFNF